MASAGNTRVLSQEEIDNVFRKMSHKPAARSRQATTVPYDFRRPDRIPKDQLREIHLLHENFCRNLAGSLSAYLRVYAVVNLVSVLQLSYAEFLQCFPSPTSIAVLSLRPFDGKGLLEINPALAFPIIEILLGGHGKPDTAPKREITEIERSVLEGVIRLILKDLREAWTAVASFDLVPERMETEPQLAQTLSPNEAVVAVGVEVKLGECVGMLNFGVPAIIVKMLRQRFDHRWGQSHRYQNPEDACRIWGLTAKASIVAESRLEGNSIALKTLLRMQPGDVLALDHPVDRPLQLALNGQPRFAVNLFRQGNRKAVELLDRIEDPSPSAKPPQPGRGTGSAAKAE
jgi:flagellar motor switch protein FliM